jgi:hypothetical protein
MFDRVESYLQIKKHCWCLLSMSFNDIHFMQSLSTNISSSSSRKCYSLIKRDKV